MDFPPLDVSQIKDSIVQEVVACGLKQTGVSVQFDELTQELAVIVSVDAGADESKFACLEKTSVRHEIFFEDESLQSAYWAPIKARFQNESVENAREHLASKGLLDRLPTLESEGSIEALLPALECHCGFKSGSVLSLYGDQVTLNPTPNGDEFEYEKIACLLATVRASGITNLGFIGNERYPASDE